MGFLDSLMNGLQSNPVRQQREANVAATKQEVDQRSHEFDMALWDKMNEMGALPVVGGAVHAPRDDTSAPVDLPDVVTTRPVDKTRLFTHKTADGQTVQFELPDQPTQQRRALYQHMQNVMGGPQQQVRAAENANVSAANEAGQLGHGRGVNEAAQENRQAIGLDVPSELDQVLPGISKGPNGQPRKILPSEADDLFRGVGEYANYKSEAEARKNPQKKVAKTELSRDDQGNQVQINTYSDGSIEELPVKAKGVTAKTSAAGGITPFQQHTIGREDEADVHNRAMVWQNKIDDFEKEQAKLSQENIAHGQEMTEIGTQLANGELKDTSQGKFKTQAIRRKGLLQSLIDGNNERFKTVESQKKSAQKIKDSIRGANGMEASPTQAAAQPAPKSATRAQIAAAAKKLGVTPEAAAAKYQSLGVKIID